MGGKPAGRSAASTSVSLDADGLEHAAAFATRPAVRARTGPGPSFGVRHSRVVRVGARDSRGAIRPSGDPRAIRGGAGRDPARRLLVLAVRGLPPARRDWAQAMLAEFDQVQGRRARWRFSLGCAWAAGRIRVQSPEPGGAGLARFVLGCAVISLALVGYGLVHYPGLRSEPNVWGAMSVFLATLLAYAGSRLCSREASANDQLSRVATGSWEGLSWEPAGCSASPRLPRSRVGCSCRCSLRSLVRP